MKSAAFLIGALALQVGITQWYFTNKYTPKEAAGATCAHRGLDADAPAERWANATATAATGESRDPSREPRIHVLHEDARIFLYENFLTEDECDHIMRLAEPRMARSGVVDTATGVEDVSNVRTSSGMFLERGADPIVADIEKRIAKWSLMPVGNGEGLQVLRYYPGQEYEGHYDYFFHKAAAGRRAHPAPPPLAPVSNGGNRYATILMYLNDVEEGGETTFPNIPAPGGDNGPDFSPCARHVLAAKPRKGSAVLFHSIKPTGELERRSLHTACPVVKGVKWSAPKWVHVGHYAQGDEQPVEIPQHTQIDENYPQCSDLSANCESWAGSGECERNPEFMIGSADRKGQCIKACAACDRFYEVSARVDPRIADWQAQQAEAADAEAQA